jgi:hypothetical protein
MELAELLGLTYREAAALDPWHGHWSAIWGTGAENQRKWFAAGRPTADRSALVYVGDSKIGAQVRAVLERLPEAVAHFLVGNVVVFGVGIQCAGVLMPRMPRPPCDDARPILIGRVEDAIVVHEFAHAYQIGLMSPALQRAMPDEDTLARVREAFLDLDAEKAVETGTVDEMVRKWLQHERAADAFAGALGFPIDTVARRVGYLRAEIMRRGAAARSDTDTKP